MSIGFDRLADQFFNDPSFATAQTGYPPFNITKHDVEGNNEPMYAITLAVAGFTKNDIDISIEDGSLKIEGKTNVMETDESVEFLHKGIAERNFIRTFKLADYVEVESAKLEDGILRINLFRNVPEAMKPKTIDIS
jgi:molecular chaperone IbpA|tara:strand:+ start:307 stop:714 length:408 start_codon:yes stop_codon:yes gene_type:complete